MTIQRRSLSRESSFESVPELPRSPQHSSHDPRIAPGRTSLTPHRRASFRGARRGDGSATGLDAPSLRRSLIEMREKRQHKQRWRERKVQLLLFLYIAAMVAYFLATTRRLASSDHTMPGAHRLNAPVAGPRPSLSNLFTGLIDQLLGRSPLEWMPAYPMRAAENIRLSTASLVMCSNALWHTVETTTIVLPDGESFVHTGDIDDLWLRDSAAQVHPLLVPRLSTGTAMITDDPRLDRIVSGLIKRTAMYIRHDPYANAFRIDDTYVFSEEQKHLGRHDLISTWNYALDSACYYLRMLYFYWKESPNGNSPHSVLHLPAVVEAITIMIDVWTAEQQHENDVFPTGPLFDCLNCHGPIRYPGLPRNGKGLPTNASSGLTWTGFRPSDDDCQYNYLVPANMFAVVALGYAEELAKQVWKDPTLANKARKLASEIDRGLQEHAIVEHPKFGRIYAYEVDGLGNANLMDDANVPSLLSIPYLGYDFDPAIYANTRRFIFSAENPCYRAGTNKLTGDIEGYGSPHMSAAIRNNIWPMSIAMQALTSDDEQEKARLVEKLVQASAGTGWMHESFDVHNPAKYTRAWFCWADSLYAELVMSMTDLCPHPRRKYKVMDWRDPVVVPGGPYAADS